MALRPGGDGPSERRSGAAAGGDRGACPIRSTRGHERLLGETAPNAADRGAARGGARRRSQPIERQRWLLDLAANLYQGISLGSILLLAAIGLAITFGVMGVINMAHGEMIMLGAYSAFVVQELFRAFLPGAWFDLLSGRRGPGRVPVAGAVRRRRRARPDPLPLRPAAGDPARDLGPEPDPAADRAHDLRRAEPGGRQPELDDGRLRAGRRHRADLQPPRHHRLLSRRAGGDRAAPALLQLRPADARGHAEPRAWPRRWASTPRASTR